MFYNQGKMSDLENPNADGPNTSGPVVTTTQQLTQLNLSSTNAKFPYLKKDEYDLWAMKMQNWITNADVNLWKIVLKGNHARRTAQDASGALYYLEPESAEEIAELQREERVRTILLQAVPDDHYGDFHNMHDARDI